MNTSFLNSGDLNPTVWLDKPQLCSLSGVTQPIMDTVASTWRDTDDKTDITLTLFSDPRPDNPKWAEWEGSCVIVKEVGGCLVDMTADDLAAAMILVETYAASLMC